MVRILLVDEYGAQFMILEAYPLISEVRYLTFSDTCDETCFLDQLRPYSVIIQVVDAKLTLKSFSYTVEPKENAAELRYEAKRNKDADKIEAMNRMILYYNMEWVAGNNALVASYYEQKKNMFGDGYNLRGYEYYSGGVFEFLGHRNYPKVDPEMVRHFDWRERHGANDPSSPYWDGDNYGTGWLTSVKDQGSHGTCWAFSAVGQVEAIANLYANDTLDFDLSERELVICHEHNCDGGSNIEGVYYICNNGVVSETCFPYDSLDCANDTCADKCNPPDILVKFFAVKMVEEENFDSVRLALINSGPLTVGYSLSSGKNKGWHAVVLSGFTFDNTDSSCIWIIKNSWGTSDSTTEYGFCNIKIDSFISDKVAGLITPVKLNGTSLHVNCLDLDHDGYYFWGIGKKPEGCLCSNIEDCDDSDSLVAGYDENYNCPCILEYNSTAHHIQSDTIWESKVYINHNVEVDSGACLTIKSDALFSSEAKILVLNGGKLILDGGKLTNACPETLWGGIVVYGYDTAQYYNQYFGVVNIINGGTIENARIGISTNYCPLCENPQSLGGGIIRADGAIFRNNGIAVEFVPFRNMYQRVERPYLSSFANCRFEYTEYLNDFSDFKYFVKLNQVNGIRFKGCDFISDTLSLSSINEETYKYRTGIYAVGSQFYVEEACLSQSVPCTRIKTSHFHGLNYGIYALGIDGARTVSVQKTFFDSNKMGIYLSAIPDVTIVQDTFEIVKEKTNSLDTLCGLYLDNCTGFQVEENNFKGDYCYTGIWGSCHKQVGVVINNSGEENNRIYNNSFDSLFIGTLALNVNRNSGDKRIGLQILCNDYDSSFYDIAVTAHEYQNESGIAAPQGSSGLLKTSPANNTFSYTWHNLESDYANDCQDMVYWHLKDTTSANTKPKSHSPEVDPLFNRLNNQLYVKDSCCPSSFAGGGGGSIEELRLKINEYSIKSDSVRSILQLLVDGGDTYQMTMDVQNSIPEIAEETAELLLVNSPFLSDSVMLTAIAKENVLTPAMITSVLYENPQAAKSDTIQHALDDREQLLADEQRTFIDQGLNTIGAKEMLEANYSQYLGERTVAFNNLIRYFKTDTITINPSDSIINLYLEDNSINSNYSLAFEYLIRGDTLNAIETLSSILMNFDLTDAELVRHQDYVDYFNVLMTSGMYLGYNAIDTSVNEGLLTIASSSEGLIQALARNILLSENIITYNEPFIFPDQNLKSTKYKKHNSIITITDNSLKLYPNPALNYVIVDYSVAESASHQSIKIIDISGRTCYDIAYFEPKGYMIIPLKDLSNGIYIFQLCQNRLPVISKKLIISK
jgi:hypothetical protein